MQVAQPIVGEFSSLLLFWQSGSLCSWFSDLALGGQVVVQWLGREVGCVMVLDDVIVWYPPPH